MARHVTAAAVANSFSVPNASCDDDDVVIVILSKVADSSELVLHSLYTYIVNFIHNSKLYT